ncbi:MAG: hypothetical protein RMJ19_01555 [Gemmatales bacterium]|nr:hypothetical protein [Gemmatales bacterium]MCS7159131.1 hypothetical protein [Gemmatales bacterium]MDW8174331.1 hypothetical protein [Gemmatales bacterium]MDW8222957.1 hypothetical protein [Gemmatales bacterium]
MRYLSTLIPFLMWAGFCWSSKSEPVEVCHDGPSGYPRVKKLRQVTSGPKHHFCGCYYGICPWDATGRYLVVLETEFSNRLPQKNDEAALCLVDLETGQLRRLGTTQAWNFQQGAMVHWLGTAPDKEIIYNDYMDGHLISVILNVHTGERRTLPLPVAAVAPDGKTAISINFHRLRRLRPGYGYAGGEDPFADEPHPANDGLFLIDLRSGATKLILSLEAIWKAYPLSSQEKEPLFINHVIYNRSGDRLFFLARLGDGRLTACMTVGIDGSQLVCLFPYSVYGGSHYDWLDERRLVITRYQPQAKPPWVHLLLTDGKPESAVVLAPQVLTRDGHCHVSPDGKWLVTDTYPDEDRKQSLYLMRLDKSDTAVRIARFYSPPDFRGDWRCDLHPRWSRDGKQICIDSTHDGTRQVYILELAWANHK